MHKRADKKNPKNALTVLHSHIWGLGRIFQQYISSWVGLKCESTGQVDMPSSKQSSS